MYEEAVYWSTGMQYYMLRQYYESVWLFLRNEIHLNVFNFPRIIILGFFKVYIKSGKSIASTWHLVRRKLTNSQPLIRRIWSLCVFNGTG